jgi:hypothetical protein
LLSYRVSDTDTPPIRQGYISWTYPQFGPYWARKLQIRYVYGKIRPSTTHLKEHIAPVALPHAPRPPTRSRSFCTACSPRETRAASPPLVAAARFSPSPVMTSQGPQDQELPARQRQARSAAAALQPAGNLCSPSCCKGPPRALPGSRCKGAPPLFLFYPFPLLLFPTNLPD